MPKPSDFSTVAARSRLAPRPKSEPHWRFLARGRALGFRPDAAHPGAGTWCARFTVPGERRYRRTILGAAGGSRAEPDGETVLSFEQAKKKAEEWCEDRERELRGLEPRDREPYTVARAMADYLEWIRAHRKAPRQVEQVTRAHVAPELAELEVKDLTPGIVRRWHQRLAERPPRRRTAAGLPQRFGEIRGPEDRRRRQNTANRALSVLKAGLNMAYREGKVGSDDAWRRVKPFKGVDRPRVRYLEADEAVRLLNACEPDFRRIVRGALFTGCRYGELCRLRVGDFKATPLPLLALEDTKSGKSRHVYLNDQGVAFFEHLAAGRTSAELMFLRADGEPWGRSHQSRRMKDASESAELDPPTTFHELRHTYASHYLMNGGDLAGLAQQLGHADTRMTTRHYAHLADRWRADEARRHVPSFELESKSGKSDGEPASGGEVVPFSPSPRGRESR